MENLISVEQAVGKYESNCNLLLLCEEKQQTVEVHKCWHYSQHIPFNLSATDSSTEYCSRDKSN